MRNFVQHRELLDDATPQLLPGECAGVASADGKGFCDPFEAAYDKNFMTHFKGAEANKQMAFAQERFGFPGITEEDRFKGTEGSTAVLMEPLSSTRATGLRAEIVRCCAGAGGSSGEKSK